MACDGFHDRLTMVSIRKLSRSPNDIPIKVSNKAIKSLFFLSGGRDNTPRHTTFKYFFLQCYDIAGMCVVYLTNIHLMTKCASVNQGVRSLLRKQTNGGGYKKKWVFL